MHRRLILILSLIIGLAFTLPVAAAPIQGDAFAATWARTDQPVKNLVVSRTWMWGPEANTAALTEPYAEAPGESRTVQYFDKTRMEDNSWRETQLPWNVTNGLLAEELITGKLQLGDSKFEQHDPAQVNVAGDANDPNGPTYATFHELMGFGATPNGWTIIQTLNRAGHVASDANLVSYNVVARDVGAPTHHTVASVFWDFMNSSGTVYENGVYTSDTLFLNAFYATGYPLTEPYWTTVLVGGISKQVLVQVFERRVLTYTPSNPTGWKVEAGNVGQHYYTWRYVQLGQSPSSGQPGSGSAPPPPPSTGPATTFGDGMYQVGSDIAPGTYHNSDSSQGCYWERLSGFGGTLDEIIANDLTDNPTIVTISPTDKGFHSERCGTWSPDNTALTSSPTAAFGDGTYRVGRDIAPGTWRNSDSSEQCYWARLSGFGGSLDEIIANGLSTTPQIVQIKSTDVGFTAHRCGTWTRIGP